MRVDHCPDPGWLQTLEDDPFQSILPGDWLESGPGGSLVVGSIPKGVDVGQHQVTLACSMEDSSEETHSFFLTIRPSVAGQPFFVAPRGHGMHEELSPGDCVDLEVAVEDDDSDRVTISQDPVLPNSTLTTTGAKQARLRWCPDAEQSASGLNLLYLVADDGDNPPTRISDGRGYVVSISAPCC